MGAILSGIAQSLQTEADKGGFIGFMLRTQIARQSLSWDHIWQNYLVPHQGRYIALTIAFLILMFLYVITSIILYCYCRCSRTQRKRLKEKTKNRKYNRNPWSKGARTLACAVFVSAVCITAAYAPCVANFVHYNNLFSENYKNVTHSESATITRNFDKLLLDTSHYMMSIVDNCNNQLKPTVDNALNDTLDVVGTAIEDIMNDILKRYSVQSLFDLATKLFSDITNVLNSMKRVGIFRKTSLRKLYIFEGALQAARLDILRAKDMCRQLSRVNYTAGIECNRLMEYAEKDMFIRINLTKVDLESGPSLIYFLGTMNINLEALSTNFHDSKKTLNTILKGVQKQVINLPLKDATKSLQGICNILSNTTISVNKTMAESKTFVSSYATSIINWVFLVPLCFIVAIILILLFLGILPLTVLGPRLKRNFQTQNPARITSRPQSVVTLTNHPSIPATYSRPQSVVTLTKYPSIPAISDSTVSQTVPVIDHSWKKAQPEDKIGSRLAEPVLPLVKQEEVTDDNDEVILRRTNRPLALEDIEPSLFETSTPTSTLSRPTSGFHEGFEHFPKKRLNVYKIHKTSSWSISLVSVIVGMCCFFMATVLFCPGYVLHTEVCHYFKTPENLQVLDTYLNSYLKPELEKALKTLRSKDGNYRVKLDNITIPLNIKLPNNALKLLTKDCNDEKTSVFKLLHVEKIVNVSGFIYSPGFQQILNEGKTTAKVEIKKLNVKSLVPSGLKTMLTQAQDITQKFVDQLNYRKSITELQKPLIVSEIPFNDFLNRLENIVKQRLRHNPTDVEATILKRKINDLRAAGYYEIRNSLKELSSDFNTLQNTRTITTQITGVYKELNTVMKKLENRTFTVTEIDEVFDSLIPKSLDDMTILLERAVHTIVNNMVTCAPLSSAIELTRVTLCDIGVPVWFRILFWWFLSSTLILIAALFTWRLHLATPYVEDIFQRNSSSDSSSSHGMSSLRPSRPTSYASTHQLLVNQRDSVVWNQQFQRNRPYSAYSIQTDV